MLTITWTGQNHAVFLLLIQTHKGWYYTLQLQVFMSLRKAFKKIAGKGQNTGYQHYSFSDSVFYRFKGNVHDFSHIQFLFYFRHETKAQRKKSENGSRTRGSAILKEVISSYEELSSRDVIFIYLYTTFLPVFLTKA